MPTIIHEQNVLTLDQRQQKPELTNNNSTIHIFTHSELIKFVKCRKVLILMAKVALR